jgi:glycosyltransferase involved in cell wall biosynthesis
MGLGMVSAASQAIQGCMTLPRGRERKGLWLGPMPSHAALAELPALSPAAVLWEEGFFSGLKAQGFELTVVSHRPEPLWPRGRLVPGALPAPADASFPTHVVGHMNAPGFRAWSLAQAYERKALALVARGSYAFVATFNPLPWHVAAATALVRRHRMPWVSFLLDDVLHDPTLERYARATRLAAGHVILSAAAAERITTLMPRSPVLHLDGAIDRWSGDDPQPARLGRPRVVYSGAHTEEAGMSLLVAAIPLVAADVTFTITGDRVQHEALGHLIARDARVQAVGWVPPAEIDEICRSAIAFVNPRPPAHGLSLASFPSKLMTYLAYGKPVASTWTPGLADVYKELLIVADGDTPRALAAAIGRAVSMDALSRQTLRNKIRAFLIPGRLWATQGLRFAAFLDRRIDAVDQAT